jgi:integrase
MAGVRKDKTQGGLYQAWYADHEGKRKWLTAPTKQKASQAANALEKEHREIKEGFRPPPNAIEKRRKWLFSEAGQEYLDWGASQGGQKGRQWSEGHLKRRKAQLTWWQTELALDTMADLDGSLPRVEKALRSLWKKGRAGKTLRNTAEGLAAFCHWAVQRGYLANHPLEGLAPFDTTPKTTRRAMTPDEIADLLNIAPNHRRLLYETAFVSGLRANELRNLTIEHLDDERCGLRLDASWTKNRKQGFQPLPLALMVSLRTFALTGEPGEYYEKNYRRGSAKHLPPANPLLYVPSNPARTLDGDLEAAGIPKTNPKGKLDFHACRTAYINLVLESGMATPKEVQELARHSTIDLTMNVYGRTRDERLSAAVESVGEIVLNRKCVSGVYRQELELEPKIATPTEIEGCDSGILAPEVGLEPTTK